MDTDYLRPKIGNGQLSLLLPGFLRRDRVKLTVSNNQDLVQRANNSSSFVYAQRQH